MAYRIVAIPSTLSDLHGHSSIASFVIRGFAQLLSSPFVVTQLAMLARYDPVSICTFVRLSVCLTVTSRYSIKIAEYVFKKSTRLLRHAVFLKTQPGESSFLTPKVLLKFLQVHPNRGAKYRCGRLKSMIYSRNGS